MMKRLLNVLHIHLLTTSLITRPLSQIQKGKSPPESLQCMGIRLRFTTLMAQKNFSSMIPKAVCTAIAIVKERLKYLNTIIWVEYFILSDMEEALNLQGIIWEVFITL